jgi:hypothetical protein
MNVSGEPDGSITPYNIPDKGLNKRGFNKKCFPTEYTGCQSIIKAAQFNAGI